MTSQGLQYGKCSTVSCCPSGHFGVYSFGFRASKPDGVLRCMTVSDDEQAVELLLPVSRLQQV